MEGEPDSKTEGPDHEEWSDGTPRAVMGPGQPNHKRLAAIEERLREAEANAQSAMAEVKDDTTARTIQSRVAELEDRVEELEGYIRQLTNIVEKLAEKGAEG